MRLLYRRKDNLYRHLKEKHQSGAGLQNPPVDINHPDQYYTIIKEKGKKMPRFNTESNEYRVTFNELNVQNTGYPFVCTTIAFATWTEAVVVVFSLVSIEIFLSSKTLLAYSAGKGIVVFVISITPLLRRKGRRCLDLTPNPTSTELRSMN
jgi:hypothetical protein